MANHAYAGVWTKGFSEATLLRQFESLLGTAPFSSTRPGFIWLVARAVDAAETPLLDEDLRTAPLSAADVVELAREHVGADCALEVTTQWDLWTFDVASTLWVEQPERLVLLCRGLEYDDGAWEYDGHFQADMGFEHLFTGHAGLLGFDGRAVAPPQDPVEEMFLQLMSSAENRREYQEKTCENIRRLQDWLRRVSAALPVERMALWSEGEENFEARMDEIVAVR